MQRDRVLSFDRLYNFREIGGLMTESGDRMKTGTLFRSDEMSRLSETDLKKLEQLNIKLVCDLRTSGEESKRTQPKHRITVVNVSIHDKSQEFTRFEFFKFLVGNSNNIDFEKIMKDIYFNMAYVSTLQIKEIINLLCDENNLPAVIHCKGGKDRTGFIAAIIQLLVGVPYETVLDDYLLSNDLIGPRMKKVEKMIRWISLFRVSPEKLKPVLEVRREYLESIYHDIVKKYGTIENYLCQACDIDQKQLEKLKVLVVDKRYN